MAQIADRYRLLAAHLTDRVAAVAATDWANQSPCTEWTAADIVAHLVEVSRSYLTQVGGVPPVGPAVHEDPVVAWGVTRDALQRALDDPAVAGTEYDGILGRVTLEQGVDQLLCFDLLVHTWDLARSAGLDERLDPVEVRRVYEQARSMTDFLSASGAFAAPVEPPADADLQTTLLCLLGRAV